MSSPYNLLFIQPFLSLLLSHFFANAAIIQTNSSAISDASHSLYSPDFNSSAFLNGTTRCMLPVPPLAPVSLGSCEPTFRRLLSAPDAEIPSLYHSEGGPIRVIYSNGCAISLDKRNRRGDILISKRMIVDYACRVLVLCEHFGQGGWTYIDWSVEWIVIVSGRLEIDILVAKTAAVSGSMVSMDVEKE